MGCTSGAPAPAEACGMVLRDGCWQKQLKPGVYGKSAPLASKTAQFLGTFLQTKGATSLYADFVADLKQIHKGYGHYDPAAAGGVVRQYWGRFENLGIGVYFCAFEDIHFFKHQWFEFVDREIDSDYCPKERVGQSDRESKDESLWCSKATATTNLSSTPSTHLNFSSEGSERKRRLSKPKVCDFSRNPTSDNFLDDIVGFSRGRISGRSV